LGDKFSENKFRLENLNAASMDIHILFAYAKE